ncbi:unnamed protein product [Linum trigynum]|uniref:LHY n=1 Tax=Linum trigynum TaxID=586398 RepID=A0AAV2FM55_9ROSI
MDTYSSGEDLVIKARKPYTITKQRERWTEEEHNRFLEALKLYGRAWQRIEEHIGTKTAVQIRSHAQKFFSKLEKEAVAKGVPVGKAIDIDIPPPRPKRKPSNPYPRKTGVSPITSHAGAKDGNLSTSLPCSQQVLDLEKEPPPEKPSGDENSTGAKENHDESCSELFNCSSSASSLKKTSTTPPELLRRIPSSFREFVPCLKDAAATQDATNESHSHITTEHPDGNRKWNDYKNNRPELNLKVPDNGSSSKLLQLGNSCLHLHEESLQDKKADDDNNANVVPPEDKMLQQNYPRHVPVHILDGRRLGTCHDSMATTVGESSQAQSNVYSLPTPSAAGVQNNRPPTSSSHQSFPSFPFTPNPLQDQQDDYRSFLQISSAFSSLIVSTLLQNPAAHAAASFAASFWPYANVENGADSSRQVVNSAPSMAAIAGATVAAATAWWAAHGLLPLCAPPPPPPPMHGASFACPPPAAIPSPHNSPLKMVSKEGTPPQYSHSETAMLAQNSTSKSHDMSSSDKREENNGGSNPNAAVQQVAGHKMNSTAPEVNNDSSEPKNRKQVDRSSCGSNTASSSEVETDALEKNEKDDDKEEPMKEGADANNPPASTTDSGCRRSRSNTSTSGDSWKSVSEEGRLAFQALFSRQVLPQSFSPPPDGEVEMQNAEHRNVEVMVLDLNRCHPREEQNAISPTHGEECSLPTIGIVANEKLKPRRTGFKPYKRCSVEARENRLTTSCGGGQGEEKESKRICLGLEGEASI